MGKFFASAVVQRFVDGDFNSGVAVVNTSTTQEASLSIQLYDEQLGTLIDSTRLPLAPGEHVARFLIELFPQFLSEYFSGTLIIFSDQPVALVTLRTRGGLVLSSLPGGEHREINLPETLNVAPRLLGPFPKCSISEIQ